MDEENWEVWETFDGRRIPVKELADSHINNIMLYLDKRKTEISEAHAMDDSITIEDVIEAEEIMDKWQSVMKKEIKRRKKL